MPPVRPTSQPRQQPPDPPGHPRPVPPPAGPLRRRSAVLPIAVAAGALALLLVGAAIAIGVARTEPTAAAWATPTCHPTGAAGCQSKAPSRGSPLQHSADPAQVLPPGVSRACGLNDQMRKTATNEDLRDQGATINQIQALAGNSAIIDIKTQANALKTQYQLAVSATDDPASTAATINLFTASTRLSTACARAGWRSTD